MKEYLKMADVFKRSVSVAEVSFLTNDHNNRCCDEYAAHAINSHDELVSEVARLSAMLKKQKNEIEMLIEDSMK